MPPPATSNGDSSSLKTISLAYDASRPEESARELVTALNPEWAESEGPIEFERFKDGITNTLFKAMKVRPGHSQHDIDQKAVLLRAYGDGTDILIDRNREAQSHQLLTRHGIAPNLLARFDNGLLYEFIEGYACTPEDLRRSDVWPASARLLGSWHGAVPTNEATDGNKDNHAKQYELVKSLIPHKPLPHLWSMMQKWVLALPNKTQAEKDLVAWLQQALEDTAKLFGDNKGLSNGKYVLSHCDLLSGNVIVKPTTANDNKKSENVADVSFIDYEYCTPAPAAFDIANHLAEWGGFDCDYSVLPTRSQRRAFLSEYATAYRASEPKTNGNATNGNASNGHSQHPTHEQDVDLLMKEVDEIRGLPGLYWGTWGLIQAMISSIDFDYDTYAEKRLGEYAAWKAEVDGSREQKGEEMPLREKRWAQE